MANAVVRSMGRSGEETLAYPRVFFVHVDRNSCLCATCAFVRMLPSIAPVVSESTESQEGINCHIVRSSGLVYHG